MCDFIESDRTNENTVHEITWKLPNGDWQYQRHYGLTFQGACRLGLWGAGDGREKTLIRVERIPTGWDSAG